MAATILRMKAATVRSGLSRSLIYAKLDPKSRYFDPDFPQPVRLSARAVGFHSEALERWIESRQRAGGGR